MSRRTPLYTSANGINRLSVSEADPYRPRDLPPVYVPKQENSWTFTLLASAVNIGMEILESPQGTSALGHLGRSLVREWATTGYHVFGGYIEYMPNYVDHFLSALRADFPNIVVANVGGQDVIAQSKRMPLWDGNLASYQPKFAVGIYFNYGRVADMVATMLEPQNGQQRSSRDRARRLRRHKHFQFMFAVATAHELCHAFTGYLSQNAQSLAGYTPPGITHLNYARPAPPDEFQNGESGRWFENYLLGGSLEFYRNPREDDGQVGMAHLLDINSTAWEIDPDAILAMVEDPRQFEFPLRTTGQGISAHERIRLGLRSLGSTVPSAPGPLPALYMRAHPQTGVYLYNVSGEELRQIPVAPRRLRAVRVA